MLIKNVDNALCGFLVSWLCPRFNALWKNIHWVYSFRFNALWKIISKCVATHFPQRIRILKIIGSAFLFFNYFHFLLVRILGKFVPLPTFQNNASFQLFPDHSIHLNKFKLKLYSESDTVHKILHKVWVICFICFERHDLQRQTGVLHEEFKYYTSFKTVIVFYQFNSLVNNK